MKKALFILIISFLLQGCSQNQSISSVTQENIYNSSHNDTSNNKQSTTDNKTEESQKQFSWNQGTEIFASHGIATPILIKGFFIGGLINGKLMKCDEFYNQKAVSFEGFKYDFYIDDKKCGTAVGKLPNDSMSGDLLKEDKYIDNYNNVELLDKDNHEVNYDIAIKADWNLFPRTYKKQSTDQEIYKTLVKNILEDTGLDNPSTTLKQVIRVDLEGDGIEEVLITADNTVNDKFERVNKGDNAIFVFRKIIEGKVKDQVVDKDIIFKDSEDNSIYRFLFRVDTIVDLDGDGIMEVVLHSFYYEGEWWGVYKLKDNQLELITGNGWGT